MSRTITVMRGDGVGGEVVDAAIRIIEATGLKLTWEYCEAGAEVFKKGLSSGVSQKTLESLAHNKVALKGPLETPVGYGEKSANVTLRKAFETFANVRPVQSCPNIPSPYQDQKIDFIVVRENVEDLYAGIEHMQTPDVAQALKLMTTKGCEKIIRFAFELARAEGRESVHCATKANILKFTEGLMKRTFERIAPEYPEIRAEHMIVDNCAHQMVMDPTQFEVVVMSNMNGDILSDLASGLVGGLGFAGSANMGEDVSIFEAVHGSAPTIAGKNVVNPTALIQASVLMLRHIGAFDEAILIENALLTTLEEGFVTQDVKTVGEKLSTTDFTDKVIERLGKTPAHPRLREYKPLKMPQSTGEIVSTKDVKVERDGVDVFAIADEGPETLGPKLEKACEGTGFYLKLISSRGIKVYPDVFNFPDFVDSWRCRFAEVAPGAGDICKLLKEMEERGIDWNHVEKLFSFDGKAGYSKAQGED